MLGISVIVPTHITFLTADSQPWERIGLLVNPSMPLMCPGTRHSMEMRASICSNTPALDVQNKTALQYKKAQGDRTKHTKREGRQKCNGMLQWSGEALSALHKVPHQADCTATELMDG